MVRISKAPEERRREIILTARKLFFEKGYNNTSIKDIVGALGVAQGLFYYYFKSKEEVFKATMEEYADEYIYRIEKVLFNDAWKLPKRIILAFHEFLELENQGKDAFLATIHDSEHQELHDKISLHVVEALTNPAIEILKIEVLETRLQIENIETTARYLLYGIFGVIHQEISINEIEENVPSLIKLIAETLGMSKEQFMEEAYA
ncbi:hypothetical protein AZF37_08760 [endosymbiont 'TC1' of Trimyema compressum]|uniref:TetR/AcrR family transcriptional regulator n=1 Tax=endosymbiont 'TC1' of Trimyema compressum TaxID=243899 RepID=UPI0007F108E5|nr:TetR/AcrR family transcriptional regulator [endosymbiont 'TC1' of Trimyema compressum]AMP21228.1 hypothetical protein AZF37_08760 [endosymbiont 'TC1' of Trimyema compressum]